MYEDWVEAGFVDNGVKGAFIEFHSAGVHLQVLQSLCFLFVLFGHGFDNEGTVINISDVGVSLFHHFFAEPGIAGPHIEDFMIFIDISSDDVFEAAETLVPVEWLSVPTSD